MKDDFLKDRVEITLTVNGERATHVVEPRDHLITLLRREFGLSGARVACEHGFCGACTVRVNGDVVRGCLTLAASLDGARVETIEGLSDSGEIRDVQDAFVKHNACQCGFCTPAMLVTAQDYLTHDGAPDRAAIREALSGNYCRCTGYQAIVDAVEEVAASRRVAEKTSREGGAA